ncbi:hypothetical protein M8C21_000668, partial [Ambrosia artemisiifolia]
LTIITKLYEPAELDIVNRCLELLLQKGVRKLEINITNYSSESPYRLPDVLLSVSVLESLTIRGCDLPSSFMLDAIKFTSLSKLRLQNVHINDEAIKYLTTSCPLLQLFEVTACHGFKRFCVHRHQNLQDVWIHYNTPVERIDIDAPNLSTLYITDIDGSGPPQMNLASCEKLTTVIYDARSLSNSNGFTNFLSNFPFVEYLVWAAPHCNNLKLSSHSLRTLELSSQCDLEEIEFNTPNLVSFSHTCCFGGLESLLRDSIHLKGFMHCYPYNIDTRWFQKLRQFLNKENGFKVFNLYIHATYSQKFTRLEKLKAIELPPYELEHVELQLDTHGKSLVIAFVDAVLWCCRPRSLTLRSSFHLTALEEHSDVVKFTCKKLLEQEDQGHTNIQIVSPSFSSLLMALPHEGKAISFIKEKVLQEEAGTQRYGFESCSGLKCRSVLKQELQANLGFLLPRINIPIKCKIAIPTFNISVYRIQRDYPLELVVVLWKQYPSNVGDIARTTYFFQCNHIGNDRDSGDQFPELKTQQAVHCVCLGPMCDDMDRISHLPDFIHHRILSFLNNTPTELVRMSYVEYTSFRFCHHNISAHKLTLIAIIHEPAELDIINRCLERLLNTGVRKLVIDFTYSSDVPKYRLPNTLLSVSVLTSLTIRHCGLPSSLTVDALNFKSLTKLSLENVPIDDDVIKYLAAGCPLLRVFEIKSCPGFKRFCVHGHQNLEIVGFIYKTPVERIDIEAPNLSRLIIKDYTGREAPQMNMALCKKLTTVTYSGRPLPNSNGFTDFLSNFPFIENLFLSNKYECNNLKLSSHSLRTLVLHSNCDVEGIEFSTPNLLFFGYSRNYRLLHPLLMDMVWPLARHSTHLKSCMQCYPDGCIDALWFQKLRQFFGKKNGFKVLNLFIHAIYSEKFTELENLKAIELQPYELEHVELQLENNEESLAHIAFVDAVLWCCCPRSLTLRSSFPYEEQSDVVMFTYKKLLEQEKQGHTNILVVSPSSSKAQKHLMDLKSSSMALPREGKASPKKKQDDETVKRHADIEILGCFGFRSCIFRTKVVVLLAAKAVCKQPNLSIGKDDATLFLPKLSCHWVSEGLLTSVPTTKWIWNYLSFEVLICIHALHIPPEFAPRTIGIPAPSRQSHAPIIHSHSITAVVTMAALQKKKTHLRNKEDDNLILYVKERVNSSASSTVRKLTRDSSSPSCCFKRNPNPSFSLSFCFEKEMDRISHLPDSIVHHILSFANTPAHLVRMSLLSKTWFHLTASNPILVFDIHDFASPDCFFKYVEYTISRFCHHNINVPAHTLNLRATIHNPAELDVVNRCLRLLLANGVKELHISVDPKYRMPDILLSVSVLQSLTIWSCDLPSSFKLDAVKLTSLVYLELVNVHIDDEAIKSFTTGCPLLREFEIIDCHGFTRFCVHGHQNLQRVTLFAIPVEIIDIEAPNLTYLYVARVGERGPPQMNLASCKKLTSLSYEGCPLPNSNGFLSNFPFLENLALFSHYIGDNLKLSSNSLRTLEFNSDFELEEIELCTPSLDLFIYSCSENYTSFGISHLPHLKACMRCYPDHSIDMFWLQQLRLFLDKENGFKAFTLYIHKNQEFIVSEKLKAIELLPYELEHIELHFEDQESSDHAAFVEAVLCCFRPRSLTLRSSFPRTDFEEKSSLVKFTYERLLEQENQGHANIHIVSPYSSKAQKQFRGLMLLPKPSLREEKAISFIKEEVMALNHDNDVWTIYIM